MQGIESASRGYILTGDEKHIASYHDGAISIAQHQKALRRLTADNSDQQRRLSTLDTLIAQKSNFLDSVIRLRQRRDMGAAAGEVSTGHGQLIMAQFQDAARDAQRAERALLAARTSEADKLVAQSKFVLILGTILGLLITGAAGLSVHREFLKRGRAEGALRESEEEYRMLLDGVQDYAIILLDPAGRIVTWNTGAERIKGYSAEEAIGRDFSCFFTSSAVKQGVPSEILRITAADGRYEDQGMRRRKDGSHFLAGTHLTALRDGGGQLRGFTDICRDLTETKEAGAKYRGLLEAAPDAIVVVDQASSLWNSAIGMVRVSPCGRMVSTFASSTRIATAMSLGCVAMQASLAPMTAC
jgi:PAS domain S-box-containing protein